MKGVKMLNIQREETFNEIVDKYSSMIYRIAYQNVYNIHDAEDIMQDVFVQFISKKSIIKVHWIRLIRQKRKLLK